MTSIASTISGAIGFETADLAFWMSGTALLLAVIILFRMQHVSRHERTFKKAKRQGQLDKEIMQRRTEAADVLLELLEFTLKHYRNILETNNLDNAEESLRWTISKHTQMTNLSFQMKRFFGKDMYKRYNEILDKMKIISRLNDKEKTYEIFVMNRDEADKILKRIIIKMASLQESIMSAADKV